VYILLSINTPIEILLLNNLYNGRDSGVMINQQEKEGDVDAGY
jgi:hypothetical protein